MYGRALLPFAERPALAPPGEVRVALRADPVGGDWVWSWRTELCDGSAKTIRFEQSTFRGHPLPRRVLRERAQPVAVAGAVREPHAAWGL